MESVFDPRRPYTFDRVVRMVLTAIGVCFAVWLIRRLSGVLLPFVVAWLIAYMLEPIVQRNRRLLKCKGRFVPIVITLFEVGALLLLLGTAFLPSLLKEMHNFGVLITQYVADGNNVAFIPPQVHQFLQNNIDLDKVAESMTRDDYKQLFAFVGRFLSGSVNLILGIFSWFLVLLYVVFIMLDYEKLIRGFKRMVPPRYRRLTFAIAGDVKRSMNHYFRGQAMVALCVGVLFSIGFLIVGIPMAVALGLFIGLLNMVPYLQLISILPTTVICIVYSVQDGVGFWPVWWSCMAVYVVVQCIQDLLLTPKIMGKAMGLNPAIILLSLSIWGSLLGFIGLIIALPLTTLLLAYYDQYIIRRGGETPADRRADVKALKEAVESPGD